MSTGFPVERTYPLICTWNVKVSLRILHNFLSIFQLVCQVSKNCRHARIVLRIDEHSRLPNEKECNKGYLRVSPFMQEAKYI